MKTIRTYKHFSKSSKWFKNPFGTGKVLCDFWNKLNKELPSVRWR